jgi:hypothetical protein
MDFSRREILLLGSVRESIMTPSETSSEKNNVVRCDNPSSHFSTVAMEIENRLSTLTPLRR